MPAEAKLGLVLGIGLTIALALFLPKDRSTAGHQKASSSPLAESDKELQGQTTSNRK
jgi:hypothetical protein